MLRACSNHANVTFVGLDLFVKLFTIPTQTFQTNYRKKVVVKYNLKIRFKQYYVGTRTKKKKLYQSFKFWRVVYCWSDDPLCKVIIVFLNERVELHCSTTNRYICVFIWRIGINGINLLNQCICSNFEWHKTMEQIKIRRQDDKKKK